MVFRSRLTVGNLLVSMQWRTDFGQVQRRYLCDQEAAIPRDSGCRNYLLAAAYLVP